MSFAGVEQFRKWSLRRGLLDVPNDRSSHVVPIPRGGGLVVAAICIASYVSGSFLLNYDLPYGYLIGAILIVMISWLDDIYSISVVWRFSIHSVAAAALIYNVGYFSSFYIPYIDQSYNIGIFGSVISFVWIVWLVNSYNFMDGIDGIAGVQAIAAGIGWLIVGILLDLPVAIIVGGVTMSASAGFLIHNWQPAKIFMGDAGSAFLGFTFAAMPFLIRNQLNENTGYLPIVSILFVWLFVFDSVATFFSRLMRGEKVWHAHRKHIYQKLVISGRSHQYVTLLYGLLAIVIAVPTAFALSGFLGLENAILPVTALSTLFLLVMSYRSHTVSKPE